MQLVEHGCIVSVSAILAWMRLQVVMSVIPYVAPLKSALSFEIQVQAWGTRHANHHLQHSNIPRPKPFVLLPNC